MAWKCLENDWPKPLVSRFPSTSIPFKAVSESVSYLTLSTFLYLTVRLLIWPYYYWFTSALEENRHVQFSFSYVVIRFSVCNWFISIDTSCEHYRLQCLNIGFKYKSKKERKSNIKWFAVAVWIFVFVGCNLHATINGKSQGGGCWNVWCPTCLPGFKTILMAVLFTFFVAIVLLVNSILTTEKLMWYCVYDGCDHDRCVIN